MHLREIDEHGLRIFIGALEAPRGDGYTAAVAVQRLDAPAGAPALYRDDHLACGHRWPTADDALSFALRQGRAWIRAQSKAAGTPSACEASAG